MVPLRNIARKLATAVVTLALLWVVVVGGALLWEVVTRGTIVSVEQLTGFVVALVVTIPFILLVFALLLVVVKGFLLVGRRLAPYTPARLRTGLGERVEWDLSQSLRSAVIGGVIGGLVFASLNPLVVPVVSDIHTAFDVAAEPEPTIRVWRDGEPTVIRTADGDRLGGRWEDGDLLFRVTVENEDRTPVADLTLHLRFPGCLEAAATDADVRSQRRGMLALAPDKLSFHGAEPAGDATDCHSTVIVHVADLPHNRKGRLFFVVDETPEGDAPARTDARIPEIDCTFVWEYNGRQYGGGGFKRQPQRVSYGVNPKPGAPWEYHC